MIGEWLDCFAKKRTMQTIFVNVDLVPLDWILTNAKSKSHKLLDLIPIIESIDDNELYTSNFIGALKESVLMLNKEAFNWCFVPFVLQGIVSVVYFSLFTLSIVHERTFISTLLEIMVGSLTFYFLYIEYLQQKA